LHVTRTPRAPDSAQPDNSFTAQTKLAEGLTDACLLDERSGVNRPSAGLPEVRSRAALDRPAPAHNCAAIAAMRTQGR